MTFFKFPSLTAFHNKRKLGKKQFIGEQTFLKKTKLHGMNAAIVIHQEKGVYTQSRNRVLSLDNDNAGFDAFVKDLTFPENVKDIFKDTVVIYGEWCGNGIQRGDAITKIDRKIFATFCVATHDSVTGEPVDVWVKDEDISNFITMLELDEEKVIVIDDLDSIKINFNEETGLGDVIDTLNVWVDNINECDEWVKDKFGVEGYGEGYVMTPLTNDYEVYNDWTFKIKTEKHNVNKTKKPAMLNPEISKDVDVFVERFLTEQRMQQAVSELGGEEEMSMKKLGDFLKWVGQDIKKESVDEIEISNFEFKDASKRINIKAKFWFMNKFK